MLSLKQRSIKEYFKGCVVVWDDEGRKFSKSKACSGLCPNPDV